MTDTQPWSKEMCEDECPVSIQDIVQDIGPRKVAAGGSVVSTKEMMREKLGPAQAASGIPSDWKLHTTPGPGLLLPQANGDTVIRANSCSQEQRMLRSQEAQVASALQEMRQETPLTQIGREDLKLRIEYSQRFLTKIRLKLVPFLSWFASFEVISQHM